MKYTQNFKIAQVTQNTLVIGVDIAKSEHYARAFDWRRIELSKVISFRTDKRGFRQFREWAEKIARNEGKNKVIVGIELTGHYWFTFAVDVYSNSMMVVQVNRIMSSSLKKWLIIHSAKMTARTQEPL